MTEEIDCVPDDSLFASEEQLIEEAAAMLRDVDEVADSVSSLARAYQQGYQEQKRLVSLSDRMQLSLHTANRRLAEQTKVLERMNLRLHHEIKERERLAYEQERFFQMLAHEFSTPISIINLSAELLEASGDAQGQAPRELERIQAAAQRLGTLLENYLAEGRLKAQTPLQQPQLTAVAPLTVLDNALQDARAIWPRHRFELHSSGLPSHIEVDPELLRILLCNLLDNAAKYGPAEGLITLEAHATAGELELAVQDSGPGIPAAERERLFERFQRGGNSSDNICGFGLGLHLVAHVLSLHGGSATLSEPAQGGLRVSCRLPLPQ